MEYLADVLPRLARGNFTRQDLRALLPSSWKAARAQPTTVQELPASASG
jgi:hypothetical protein